MDNDNYKHDIYDDYSHNDHTINDNANNDAWDNPDHVIGCNLCHKTIYKRIDIYDIENNICGNCWLENGCGTGQDGFSHLEYFSS